MSKKGGRGTFAPGEITHATLVGGTFTSAANICASDWPAIANAHAVAPSSCTLKSPTQRSVALDNTANCCASH